MGQHYPKPESRVAMRSVDNVEIVRSPRRGGPSSALFPVQFNMLAIDFAA